VFRGLKAGQLQAVCRALLVSRNDARERYRLGRPFRRLALDGGQQRCHDVDSPPRGWESRHGCKSTARNHWVDHTLVRLPGHERGSCSWVWASWSRPVSGKFPGGI